jgi:hypothetical protein
MFNWENPEASLLELPATTPSGFCFAVFLYFVLDVRLPAHWRTSAHFFSKIAAFRCATDLGSGSTPRVSGLSATSFAQSSAFSFPRTPARAGHPRIAMVMPGRALRSDGIYFRAGIAYMRPGLGSSDAIRLMATWASVTMVTIHGADCRLAAVSRDLASAARSAS